MCQLWDLLGLQRIEIGLTSRFPPVQGEGRGGVLEVEASRWGSQDFSVGPPGGGVRACCRKGEPACRSAVFCHQGSASRHLKCAIHCGTYFPSSVELLDDLSCGDEASATPAGPTQPSCWGSLWQHGILVEGMPARNGLLAIGHVLSSIYSEVVFCSIQPQCGLQHFRRLARK